MKIIYSILFFTDTGLLLLLSFILLKMIDSGAAIPALIAILAGIAISIFFLIYFLRRYLKAPGNNS